jgi:SAM-dependent methyltransferase
LADRLPFSPHEAIDAPVGRWQGWTVPPEGQRTLPPVHPRQVERIREIGYFRDGIYADLDIDNTLEYMRRRYVAPLAKRTDIRQATLADCAAGFGWLSFAYLLAGGKAAVLVDVDGERLRAAEEIARVLELRDRCVFVRAPIQELGWRDDEVEIFASVETLEHVGRPNAAACVETMARAARDVVLLTTPNWLFPVVAHDTQLPLAHWLPAPLRRAYARRFGREREDEGNHFLRPWSLAPLRRKFRPDTKVQTFSDMAEFDGFYPHYLPYGRDERERYRAQPKQGLRRIHQATAALLGTWAFSASPNLSSIWVRKDRPLPAN